MGKANLAAVLTAALVVASAAAYTNHTVGGDKGWFFDVAANVSATNYTAWAANQTFSLGDFLIFKTNTNQTVIQTYNATLYRSCSIDDASDGDAIQYGGGGERFGQPLTVEVPLTIRGANYYFSSAGDDGVQCSRGMAFAIDVARGAGLPPSLNQPPPPPYVEPPGADSAQPPPGGVGAAQPQGNGGGFGVGANLRDGWRSAPLLLLPVLLF